MAFVFHYISDWTDLDKHFQYVNCNCVILIIMCEKPAKFTYGQLTNGLRDNPNMETVMIYFVDMYSSMSTVVLTIDECDDATRAVDVVLANCDIINKHPKLQDMIRWLYLSWGCYQDVSDADTYPIPNRVRLSKLTATKLNLNDFARYYSKCNNLPTYRQN